MPNPSFGPIRVDFVVGQKLPVLLTVIDVQGRVVATLVDGMVEPGSYQANWSGAAPRGTAAPGLYFVRFHAGERTVSRRFVLSR